MCAKNVFPECLPHFGPFNRTPRVLTLMRTQIWSCRDPRAASAAPRSIGPLNAAAEAARDDPGQLVSKRRGMRSPVAASMISHRMASGRRRRQRPRLARRHGTVLLYSRSGLGAKFRATPSGCPPEGAARARMSAGRRAAPWHAPNASYCRAAWPEVPATPPGGAGRPAPLRRAVLVALSRRAGPRGGPRTRDAPERAAATPSTR